jgi:roadblock/LC7 domain-containing protein
VNNPVRRLFTGVAAVLQRRLLVAGLVGVAVVAMALTLAVTVAKADSGQSGTTLTETITGTPHWTRTFPWTISKSVTPSTWTLFTGDSGTSGYTVAVTKGTPVDAAWIDGRICVTNGGSVDTQGLSINAVLSNPNGSTIYNTAAVDVSSSPVIPAGQQACYNYSVSIPPANVAGGATYKVTADTTITNHSGHLGTPFGPNEAVTVNLQSSPDLIDDTIHVTDSNGSSWSTSSSTNWTYSLTFVCDGDQGMHNNTATITETNQSASAAVQVNCYHLGVVKTAATSFTRTYTWNIVKTADQSSLTLALNQSYLVNYTVSVGATHADSNYAVTGSITIHNPAPIDATINSVSDALSSTGAITTSCPVSFPYTLPAGGDLVCSYSTPVADGSSQTNTATATLQNYSYAAHGTPTAHGTTGFNGWANVDFSHANITYVDASIAVSDTLGGSLGTVTYNGTDGVQHTFTYSYTVGPFSVCGPETVSNTATFTTSDTGTTGSNSWAVSIAVPCNAGCTLTLGYWKTHAGFTGNNPDMLTPLLPIWLGTANGSYSTQVTNATQAVLILNFQNQASNGIYKLQGQLLAAKLDIAAGADPSAISSTITAADNFLATNPLPWSKLSKAQQTVVLGWVTTLDNYNNGLIGPGHCSQ